MRRREPAGPEVDRRTFLQSSGAMLAGLTLPSNAAGSRQPRTWPRDAGRIILPINRGWRYSETDNERATAIDFDDSRFEQVTIPHTNRLLPWHSFDERSYQFKSVYRRRFTLPAGAAGHHVFVDFDGAMTASTVWINGHRLEEYKGGYTPFSFDLTAHVDWERPNVLVVQLDSSERADIPPFGGSIDYLTFGGIYRDVRLRLVSPTHLENIFARPRGVLTREPSVDVSCFVAQPGLQHMRLTLEAELRDGGRVLATARRILLPGPPAVDPAPYDLVLTSADPIRRWDIADPALYSVVVRLEDGDTILDEDTRRFGFREARFTERGFELNGRAVKLRGLNRHQTYPYVGQAMPARVQRRDAHILKRELKCNMVRTSHYPQSPHFLDACDEVGLLVLEEIPGWQHTGDAAWRELSVDNVRRMIRRDWNHPSIVLWGVRINEGADHHELYARTNAVARSLDPTRQTGGIRNNFKSERLEDVFTMNDFDFPLQPPNHPLYLNTEFIGHTYPTKSHDTTERLTEHALRHARVHNQLGSDPRFAGGIGWCAFDYNTHGNFGSGDRVCYHGVSDIFRLPKPAAHFYASQCDPSEEVVLEPAFHWAAMGDWSNPLGHAVVFSNCDHLKFFIGEELVAEVDPDRKAFPHLPHPPFVADLDRNRWADLRIEGYVGGAGVIEKRYSRNGVDTDFVVRPDDESLLADGADATRVVVRVVDEFGGLRRYATGAIAFAIDGPADLIGDNPLALMGGCGAVWIRARDQAGAARLEATHPALGRREIVIGIFPA